jgi:hypothetical protein
MADSRWVQKAQALYTAWKQVSGKAPPSKTVLLIALCQAQLETSAGDAWPLAHNWGAVDFRAANAKELADIAAGTLKDGYWLFPDGTYSATHQPNAVGVLHSDSHPTPNGPSWYHVWFGAFTDDVAGAANFLKTIFRMVPADVLADPNISVDTYVTQIYMHCYFEGSVAGARPCGKRVLPLTPPEQANVNSYAGIINRIMTGVLSALVGWDYPTDPAPGPQPAPRPTPPPAPRPGPPPVPAPAPQPAPAPADPPTPAPAPQPAPEPPKPPAPLHPPSRPQMGWLTAVGAAVLAFWQKHPVLVVIGVLLVIAVIVDVVIHMRQAKKLKG